MKCPYCGYTESKVVDSRPTDENERIRRRRECLKCEKRFTTYEIVEMVPVVVLKKNGMQEPFDREKLLRGMLRACEKRPVSVEQMERLVDDIETELQNGMEREVSSSTIGELALAALRDVDEVAYVRFASVYRSFGDINSFLEELERLRDQKGR
ncbi:MAG: transcriptional regulator NrdR [Clostridiales bacterium]|nr:transcriptional regulator NrdR [Clostridiales bacterium]